MDINLLRVGRAVEEDEAQNATTVATLGNKIKDGAEHLLEELGEKMHSESIVRSMLVVFLLGTYEEKHSHHLHVCRI